MYDRIFTAPAGNSFFIFGPRGTGKSSWLRTQYKNSNIPYFDLLDSEVLYDLRTAPSTILAKRIGTSYHGPVIIDEIQKLPELLNEIHRLIEQRKKLQFILTGSSARKLRSGGVNLLAGRALVKNFFPLTVHELADDFNLGKALKRGLLPAAWTANNPESFLKSYIHTYLDLEVKLEGLSRNIVDFSRFLIAASFSQAAPLNISAVATDCGIERRTVSNYFTIARDILITYEIPIFSKKAKRELIKHNKFYFFDVGVYQALRPRGPLDLETEIAGASLETLVLQELMATNSYHELDYQIYYWHTRQHQEVDFILYGRKGLLAIEVKSSHRVRRQDLQSLNLFSSDYPSAQLYLLYTGEKHYRDDKIEIIPAELFLRKIKSWLT